MPTAKQRVAGLYATMPDKPIAGVFDVANITSIVHRRCADLGVNLVFDEQGGTAHTDGKTITLPALHQPITQDQLDLMYGYVIHECGHHLRDEAFKILHSAQPPEHVCALFNILEDDGMERDRANEWRGDCKALSQMNEILIERMATNWGQEKFNDAIAGKEWKCNNPEAVASLCLGQLSRLEWDTQSDHQIKRMLDIMPKNVTDLLTELIDEGWVDKYRGTKTPQDTWDTTIDLVKRLYPGNDKKEYEKMRKAGHKMNKRARNNDKDKIPAEGKAAPTKGEPDKDGKDNEAASADPEAEGKVVHWKDMVLSEHTEWTPRDDNEAGNVGIDWSGIESGGTVGLMPLHMINVIDLGKEPHNYNSSPTCVKRYLPSDVANAQFGNQIRRYLQALGRSRVARHKRHGKLDRSSIVKLLLPPIDGGDYNKKIFYQQEKHTMKDTAIFVLTDWSGSMKGPKMKSAADASQRLVYVMERILKIPVALACFSNSETECDIGYIKPFGTRGLSAEEIALRFAKFRKYTSANNDADSLHWAWHQLRKRTEERKILIVLSDGCPAGSWIGRGYDNLHYVVDAITRDGGIELYGVGIHSDAVKKYYPHYKILNSPDEINATLFNLIKDGDKLRRQR